MPTPIKRRPRKWWRLLLVGAIIAGVARHYWDPTLKDLVGNTIRATQQSGMTDKMILFSAGAGILLLGLDYLRRRRAWANASEAAMGQSSDQPEPRQPQRPWPWVIIIGLGAPTVVSLIVIALTVWMWASAYPKPQPISIRIPEGIKRWEVLGGDRPLVIKLWAQETQQNETWDTSVAGYKVTLKKELPPSEPTVLNLIGFKEWHWTSCGWGQQVDGELLVHPRPDASSILLELTASAIAVAIVVFCVSFICVVLKDSTEQKNKR